MTAEGSRKPTLTVGRYAIYGEIAAGGMATVHFGRLLGPAGFSRTVAIKRLHPQFAKDAEFVAMFLDEARLAARIRHPNVVATLDVVAAEGELLLVMEYVHGESLGKLLRALRGPMDPPIASALIAGALHGLHAAHTATNERGEALGIVHRDVSPQNILVGVDGVPRLVDFGVAKAVDRAQTTREGQLKGKFSYMAPEQLLGEEVTPRTDVFAAAVVLWESLTGRRLFKADSAGAVVSQILNNTPPPPSSFAPGVPERLDEIVARGLARDPNERFASAEDMALALELSVPLISAHSIGRWVASTAGDVLGKRNDRLSAIESSSSAVDIGAEGKRAIEWIRSSGEISDVGAPPASARSTPSQLSSITVERGALSQRPAARKSSLWLFALVAVIGLGVGGFLLRGRFSTPPAPGASAPPMVSIAAREAEPAMPSAAPAPSASPVAVADEAPVPSAPADAGTRATDPVKTTPHRQNKTKATHESSDDDLMNVRK